MTDGQTAFIYGVFIGATAMYCYKLILLEIMELKLKNQKR